MELNLFTSIIAGISDTCAAIAIFVYLELIELNFCDFNHNLRWKIIKRSEEEDLNFNRNTGNDINIIPEGKDIEGRDSYHSSNNSMELPIIN